MPSAPALDSNNDNFFISDSDKRMFKAWASVEIRDSQNETIPLISILKKMPAMLDRIIPLTVAHTANVVGQAVNFETGINPETNKQGILITGKIYDHYPSDNEAWAKVQSGEYGGVSIFGSEDTQNGKISDVYISSIGLWDSVANKAAKVVMVSVAKTNKKVKKSKELHWVGAVLANDETSTDEEMVEYFMSEGPMSRSESEFYVNQRQPALNNIHYNVKPYLGKIQTAKNGDVSWDDSTEVERNELLREVGFPAVAAEHLAPSNWSELSGKLRQDLERNGVHKTLLSKPFAGYKDFDACVAANSDKDDPAAYCAVIMRQVEGKTEVKKYSEESEYKGYTIYKDSNIEGVVVLLDTDKSKEFKTIAEAKAWIDAHPLETEKTDNFKNTNDKETDMENAKAEQSPEDFILLTFFSGKKKEELTPEELEEFNKLLESKGRIGELGKVKKAEEEKPEEKDKLPPELVPTQKEEPPNEVNDNMKGDSMNEKMMQMLCEIHAAIVQAKSEQAAVEEVKENVPEQEELGKVAKTDEKKEAPAMKELQKASTEMAATPAPATSMSFNPDDKTNPERKELGNSDAVKIAKGEIKISTRDMLNKYKKE